MTKYDPSVWKQVSSKYREIARLPEGKTGMQALEDIAPGEFRHLLRRMENGAADTYRRIYAEREGNVAQLAPDEFVEFKAAGGEASF